MKGFKTTLIRLATALIPAKRVRKRLRRRLLDAERAEWLAKTVPAVRAHAADVEAQCRAKLARGERLTVAFLVCDASMFSGESVCVTFRMKKQIMNDVIDWFGMEIDFSDETEDEVTARVTVNWHAMRHWALQYCRHVRILAPEDLAKQVQRDLAEALDRYRTSKS